MYLPANYLCVDMANFHWGGVGEGKHEWDIEYGGGGGGSAAERLYPHKSMFHIEN